MYEYSQVHNGRKVRGRRVKTPPALLQESWYRGASHGRTVQRRNPGVATGSHHLSGACATGLDYLTRRQWHTDRSSCRHSRDQPVLCLHMGAAVAATGAGGLRGSTSSQLSPHAAYTCSGGAARQGGGGTPSRRLLTLQADSPVTRRPTYWRVRNVRAMSPVRGAGVPHKHCTPCRRQSLHSPRLQRRYSIGTHPHRARASAS